MLAVIKGTNQLEDQASGWAWMLCSHQQQQKDTPRWLDHPPAFGEDPGKISAQKGLLAFHDKERLQAKKRCIPLKTESI